MEAARDKDCPPNTLSKFAKDDFRWVRVEVAENPNCPSRILKKLASRSRREREVRSRRQSCLSE